MFAWRAPITFPEHVEALARGVGVPQQNDLQRRIGARLQVSREIPERRPLILREQRKWLLCLEFDPSLAVESEGGLGRQQAHALGRAFEVGGGDRCRNRCLVDQSH